MTMYQMKKTMLMLIIYTTLIICSLASESHKITFALKEKDRNVLMTLHQVVQLSQLITI